MKRTIFLAAIFFAGHLVAAPPEKSSATGDASGASTSPGKRFTYKQSKEKPQELEVYFPPGWKPEKPVPAIILFHGGGWGGGDLDQFRYACRYFAGRGLVAITANYRLVPKSERGGRPPEESFKRACITDAKSAIRWVKQHAGELGVDPKRIIAGGGSAGGHVSVLATTNPGLNDPADPLDFDTSVVAYVLFNPAFQPADNKDPDVDALHHVGAGFPPAILFFGDQDEYKGGADAVLRKLRALGSPGTELWIAEGQKHGFFNRPPWQDVTLAQADRFLAAHGLLQGSPTLAAPAGGEKLHRAPAN